MVPTKKLVFDEFVLAILRGMEWSQDGTKGTINTQLDRKLYLQVNKALELMGGKWNKKLGCHVFKTDPRGMVQDLIESGTLVVEKDGFFETPGLVVARMVEMLPVPMHTYDRILEPSAGMGSILKHLDATPAEIVMVERNPERGAYLSKHFRGQVFVMDFMEFVDRLFDAIYMNPPFEQEQDIMHVRKAYGLLAKGGALVSIMSEGAFFRESKKAVEFRQWFEMVGGKSEKLPPESFRPSGTDVNTRIVYIRNYIGG